MTFATDSIAATLARRRVMPEVHPTKAGKKLVHPAARAPRIFADTADFEMLKTLHEGGVIQGVTTNPTLLKRAGAKSWADAKKRMQAICELLAPDPVSLELTEVEPKKMLKQAAELDALADNAVIKVAIGGYTALAKSADPFTGLRVIRALWERDVKTNATLVFNSTQALWAASAGATYVSPFLGRLADYLYAHDQPERAPGNSLHWIEDHKNQKGDQLVANTEFVASGGRRLDAGIRLIEEIVAIFCNYDVRTEILAASFRNAAQISQALRAGADILTVPGEILMTVADHPLTDEGMKSFVADSKVFAK
jgi:transaldolase